MISLPAIRSASLVLLGAFGGAFGIKGFLAPNGLIDGGVTGVAMLLAAVSAVPLGLLLILLNLPFLSLSYLRMNKLLAITGAATITLFSLLITNLHVEAVTNDRLLAAVFGGLFVGSGIGFAIRGGSILDGTEILAIHLGRHTALGVGDIILIVNTLIFSAGVVTIGLEPALYSVLTYFSATRAVDFILYGIEEYQGALIISGEHEQIRRMLLRDMRRGVTILRGSGGLDEEEYKVLFCVVTRLEFPKIRSRVNTIDPNAFVVNFAINDVHGGTTSRRLPI
jgi:uncharacterized membrane-anchored protein YitT (DUF2179 family)